MGKKLGQEPAFACMYGDQSNGYLQEGISKRFYAATEILKAILSNKNTVTIENGLAGNEVAMAYAIVDELLKQENL